MKKIYTLFLLFLFLPKVLLSVDCDECADFVDPILCDRDNRFESKTFMLTRPASHNMALREATWHDFIYNKKGDTLASYQLIALYQKSVRSDKTAKYFLFNCKSSLTVLGDDQLDFLPHDDDGNFLVDRVDRHRDVRAEWLGLPSDFMGAFSINPIQRQTGVILEYNQSVKKILKNELFGNWYFSVMLPIVVVENNMNICQFDIHNKKKGNERPRDIIEALNQKSWRYARINGKRSRVNLSMIRARLGSVFLSENNSQIAYYSELLIPTASEDEGKYIFDAISGYNGHLGIGTGVNFQFPITRDGGYYDVCFFTNLEAVFLIRHDQIRTFDLIDRPWSRYLLFNRKDGPPDEFVPGVNVLTQRVRVKPYSMIDFSVGWRIKTERVELEFGYNIWGHGNEKIECIKKFCDQWGIAGRRQKGDVKARSASLSTIYLQKATENEDIDQEDENFEFIPIEECELDLDSATSQSALNHRVHAAIGFEHKGNKIDGFFGAGGFFEFPQKNSALQLWGFWVKLGGSF